MPNEPFDKYHEVITVIITGVIIFLILTGVVVFNLLFYQKKKFQHLQQMNLMEQQYVEQLLKTQLEMQEHTFDAISQEIHDNVGQTLSLAKVQLNIIDQGETMNKPLLRDAKDSVGKALTDLRDIAKSLNSNRIKLLSLTEMTSHELQRIERLGIINTALKTDGNEQSLPEQKKLIVFRIIQESLQNIIKHSKAKNIIVTFAFNESYLQLEIADNGIGFDQTLLNKNEGLGLRNMINRAAMIGGKVTINSTPNNGTTITIFLTDK